MSKRPSSIRSNGRRKGRSPSPRSGLLSGTSPGEAEVAAHLSGHGQHPVLRRLSGGHGPDRVRRCRVSGGKEGHEEGLFAAEFGGFADRRKRWHECRAGSPTLHFHQQRSGEIDVRLILKGGGCENVGAQYSLPDERLKANRDLDDVARRFSMPCCRRKARGAGPAFWECAIGGDRATGYEFSKRQFWRRSRIEIRFRSWTSWSRTF